MLRFRGFLIFAAALGLLAVGLYASSLLASIPALIVESCGASWQAILLALFLGFVCGLIRTGSVFAAFRRKTRRWEIECEIDKWNRGRGVDLPIFYGILDRIQFVP